MTWQAPDLPGAGALAPQLWGRCYGCSTFRQDIEVRYGQLLCTDCQRISERLERRRPLDTAVDWALGLLEAPESPAAAYVRGAALGAGLVGLLWALVELGKQVAG